MTDEADESGEDDTKVRCPKCGAEVRVDKQAQEAMFATCPNGHKIELMKAI